MQKSFNVLIILLLFGNKKQPHGFAAQRKQ
jgi:hypothetical protein